MRGDGLRSAAGITLAVDYESLRGHNIAHVDTSADPRFYHPGASIDLYISGTIDDEPIHRPFGSFILEAST